MLQKLHLPLDISRATQTHFTLQHIKTYLKGLQWLRYLRKKLHIKLWHISGKLKGNNERLNIIFWGSPINKNYFSDLAFGDQCVEIKFGIKFLCLVVFNYWIKANRNTILIRETQKIPQKSADAGKCFIIPEWVGGYIDLSMDLESHVKSNKTVRCNFKKIKKNGFTYEVTKDPRQFDRFYYRMYREYATKRYGSTAILVSYDKVKNEFREGELLLIREKGRFVAGSLIGYNQKTGLPYLSKLGVIDANKDYVKNGVISALYYYSILYFKKEGFSKLALGGTRAFLDDGVLRYKVRNWNMKIQVYLDRAFVLEPMGFGSGVKKFLLNNPFVCMHENEPCSMLFAKQNESGKKLNLEKLKKQYDYNGLSKLIIKDLSLSPLGIS